MNEKWAYFNTKVYKNIAFNTILFPLLHVKFFDLKITFSLFPRLTGFSSHHELTHEIEEKLSNEVENLSNTKTA